MMSMGPEPMHRGQRLNWNHPVALIGEKVSDPSIHFCEICDLPILLYGRMIPCKHVFCYDCATKAEKKCSRCNDPVTRVERCDFGQIFLCTYGAPKHSYKACRRTYLSQRDLQAHVSHRHATKSGSGGGGGSASSASSSTTPSAAPSGGGSGGVIAMAPMPSSNPQPTSTAVIFRPALSLRAVSSTSSAAAIRQHHSANLLAQQTSMGAIHHRSSGGGATAGPTAAPRGNLITIQLQGDHAGTSGGGGGGGGDQSRRTTTNNPR